MKDITKLMNIYRECARNLWNVYFQPQVLLHKSTTKWNFFDEFDDICSLIFKLLILNPLGMISFKKSSSYDKYMKHLTFIRIIPLAESGVPIQINREVNQSYGYWDHKIRVIKPFDADLCFVDFFDFNLLAFRDFQYYLIKIINSSTNPELVDHYALIECNHTKVLLLNGSENGPEEELPGD